MKTAADVIDLLIKCVTPEFYAENKQKLDKLAHAIETEGKAAYYAKNPDAVK